MTFDFHQCGGCRTCEIACSYKCTGSFNHHLSAVRVVENPWGYQIVFSEGELPGGCICDGCKDLETPMCVEYCHDPEEMTGLIERFLSRSKEAVGVE